MTQRPRISDATRSDIPTLAAIFAAAFRDDRNTRVKAIGRVPGALPAAMSDTLASWLDDPGRRTVLKAVDPVTDEILGWACWSRHGYPDQPPVTEPPEPPDAVDAADSLESRTDRDLLRWQRILMPAGTSCRILTAIAVSPAAQRRGVGSALIGWGTAQADAEGVFCWVHASEAGFPAFARHGFAEVGRLDIDLDDHAPAPPEDGSGAWGRYTFRYLRREADVSVAFPEPTVPAATRSEVFLRYLDYFRSRVIDKVEGTPVAELRDSRLPSGWTPLELLKHLTFVELRWLEWGFAGREVADPWGDERDGRWYVGDDETLAELVAALRAQAVRTRAVIESAELADRGRPGPRWDGAEPPPLERILFHLVQEYARHLGQLDIIAEIADGPVGE